MQGDAGTGADLITLAVGDHGLNQVGAAVQIGDGQFRLALTRAGQGLLIQLSIDACTQQVAGAVISRRR